MNGNKHVNSLLTLTNDTIVRNFKYYVDNIYGDLIKSLPFLLKNKLLRRFTTSSHFWKDLDSRYILQLLINPATDLVDLTLFDVDDRMLEIFEDCKNLTKLYISRVGNCQVSTEGLMKVIQKVPNLNLLLLPNCDGVTDSVIEHLVDSCPHLYGIDIAGSKNITDRSMRALAKLDNLLHLTLSRTNVTNEGIQTLLKSKTGPKLQELRLGDCYNLTDDILVDIADTCPNLQVLIFCKRLNTSSDQTYCPYDDMKGLKQLVYTVRW